jgi:hypothetical protein
MPASQSRTPEASQIVAAIEDPGVEMGRNRMDFIVGLPRTEVGYDSICVIVDRLTKVAHFLPVKTTYSRAKLAELYMSRIICLHGVPKKVVSNRGSQFTSKLGEASLSYPKISISECELFSQKKPNFSKGFKYFFHLK